MRELYAETRLDQLIGLMLEGLARLIPGEHSGYNELDSSKDQPLMQLRPAMPEVVRLYPALIAHLHEHPQLRHYWSCSDRSPYRFSDFITPRAFRNLGIYREFYRPLETEHQLVCLLSEPGASCHIGIALNRNLKDFTDREKAVLEFLRPHLIQARRNALAFTEAQRMMESLRGATADLRVGVAVLDQAGRMKWATARAFELLERFFPGAVSDARRLPERLEGWFGQCRQRLADPSSPAPVLAPLCVPMECSVLRVSLAPELSGDYRLLLREEAKFHLPTSAPMAGLTPREAEVLHWMVEGKTSPEIAVILGTSRRTIHKHSERIFAKLGVHTRSAAVREVLSGGLHPSGGAGMGVPQD